MIVKVIQAGKAQSRAVKLTWTDSSTEKLANAYRAHFEGVARLSYAIL